MLTKTSLKRESLSEQIRDVLLARITSGELRPGDRIVELKVAAELETSQAPVREALRELETIGVVESLHNRGARVRVFDPDELRQMYEVRAQLEGYAVELLTAAGTPVKSLLAEPIRKMRNAARANDPIKLARYNAEFHRILAEHSGNKVLAEMWQTLNVKVRTMVNFSSGSRDLMQIADSHVAIVDAISSGDPQVAREAIVSHVLDNRPARNS